jgi:hypothetical protein
MVNWDEVLVPYPAGAAGVLLLACGHVVALDASSARIFATSDPRPNATRCKQCLPVIKATPDGTWLEARRQRIIFGTTRC